MSKILITGATGPLGTAVVEQLLQKTDAGNISVLVRNAEKAASLKEKGVHVLIGDYNDYDSLLAAFKGIDKLYMVSGNDLANRIQQQDNVVKAAKAAGVKHIVYTSFQRKNETDTSPIFFIAESHMNTERKLVESGLTYTILRHGIYADMIPIFAGGQLLENHTIFLPAGDNKTAFALRTDFAEAAANILLDDTGKFNNQSIELTGAEAISWNQIAETIADVTGLSIVYVSPKKDEFVAALKEAGVPDAYIGLFSGFSTAMKEGEFADTTTDLENILGRKPSSVKGYLKSVYGK